MCASYCETDFVVMQADKGQTEEMMTWVGAESFKGVVYV